MTDNRVTQNSATPASLFDAVLRRETPVDNTCECGKRHAGRPSKQVATTHRIVIVSGTTEAEAHDAATRYCGPRERVATLYRANDPESPVNHCFNVAAWDYDPTTKKVGAR